MVVKPDVGGDVNEWGEVLNTALDELEANAESRIPAALLTAKGDLLAASAAATPVRLPAGAAGQALTVDPAVATGLKWAGVVPASVLTAKGDLIAATGAAAPARLAAGITGQVLSVDPAAAAGVTWVTPPAVAAAGPPVPIYDEGNSLTDWTRVAGSGTVSVATVADSMVGGNVIRAVGVAALARTGSLVPYDPTALYRMRLRVRQTVDPSTAGESDVFAGFAGVAADGTTLVNAFGANSYNSQHSMVAQGASITADSGWLEYVGYVRGATPGTGSYMATSAAAPGQMHHLTRYIRPYVFLNYGAGNGTAEIDYVSLEIVEPAAASRLNLVTNPSFETNTTGWGVHAATPTVTIAVSPTWKISGANSLRATAGSNNEILLASSAPYVVQAGRTYTFSVYSASSTPRTISIELRFLDAANVTTSRNLSVDAPNTAAGRRFSVTATAPANTTKADLYLNVKATTPAGELHYFDAVTLEENPSPGNYFDGATAGYEWTGTAHASASRAAKPAPTPGAVYVEPDTGRRWNAIRVAGIDYWAPPAGTLVASMYRNLVAATVSGTAYVCPLDTEIVDLYGCFAPGASVTRYQPTVPGWYQVVGGFVWAAHTVGSRATNVWRNGSATVGAQFLPNNVKTAPSPDGGHGLVTSALAYLNGVSDYVEITGTQVSATALSMSFASMTLTYAGP